MIFMLRVDNLSKHFGGVKAVNDCSFSVKKGKITALIGPNGSGKSTLFNLVSGVLVPDKGSILLDGKDITKKPVEKISEMGVSRLFQQSRLFNNLSVLDNLLLAFDSPSKNFWISFFGLYSDKKENTQIAMNALKAVGLEAKAHVHARGLSFGQKRLIEISRAMLKPHKLLMLDEPVAGVTPAMRDKISGMLLEMKKTRAKQSFAGVAKQGFCNEKETVLLIEHDMNFTLKIADEVIVLDEGKVIAQGTPKEIKKNPKVLEAYLGD